MKLKDKELKLFTEIAKIKPLKIFELIEPGELDIYLNSMYSEFTLSNFGLKEPQEVAKLVRGLFSYTWDNLYNYHTKLVSDGLGNVETVTENIISNDNGSETNENINKVSAFDSETLVNNNSDNENRKHNRDNTTERILKTEKQNPHTYNTIINYLYKNYIYDIMFKDIKNILFLKIYTE